MCDNYTKLRQLLTILICLVDSNCYVPTARVSEGTQRDVVVGVGGEPLQYNLSVIIFKPWVRRRDIAGQPALRERKGQSTVLQLLGNTISQSFKCLMECEKHVLYSQF